MQYEIEPENMLNTFSVSNYRSLRQIVISLGQLNVITGANGSGKSSLYRALRLLAETAQGSVIPSLAQEGGLQSTLWAGPETIARSVRKGEHEVQGTVRKKAVNLQLGFSGSDFGYAIDLGLPVPGIRSAFMLDPVIKRECIWSGPLLRPSSMLVDRHGASVRIRGKDSQWQSIPTSLHTYDSMLSQLADPKNTPEVLLLREKMRSWRFYDHFRTDSAAPARMSHIGTHTPVLSNDGADMAAALQTIIEIGDEQALHEVVNDAFPGSHISVENHDGRFEVLMHQHGLLRPLKASELSDGTLRYLLWIAALLTPRPPELLILNEPETSLHPDLLPALGRLITRAARHSQVIVVSHATRLIASLEHEENISSIMLEKHFGETVIAGMSPLEVSSWSWPTR